jgi:tight adherence protein B
MGQAWSQETANMVDQTVGYQPPSFLVYLLPSLLVLATVMMTSLWLGPAWDVIAQRHIKDILPRLNALGMDEESVSGWMRWWGIAMFGAFLLFGVIFQMIPVGLGMVFVIFVSPRFILDWLIEIRQTKLRDQLVRASMGVANSCRAGLALAQAFEKVAAETPYPLSNELIRIVRYYKGGSRIQEALREVQKRLNLESFTVFSSSVIVSLEQGGNIATALEEISKGLQEMQRLERKLESDTASGRMLAIILSSFPIFFLGLFTVLDPASMNLLYSTLIGNLVLVVVGGIVFVSFKWCMAILDVDL